MKTLNKIFVLFAGIALSMTLSCSKEQGADLQTVDLQNDLEKSIMDKAGPELGAQILEHLYHPATNNPQRAAITYNGELCPGVVNSGTAVVRGYASFANASFWYFSGDAGDAVTIQVDRTNCEMDPVVRLYEGFGDDTLLIFRASADDNNGVPCTPACFSYADPLISGYVLPTTAVYTVAVWDFISGICAVPPLTYDIVVTGQNPCVIVIDGCDTGVVNQTLPDGTTMQAGIDACAAGAGNHGDFVSCVAHLTNAWKAAGFVTGAEKGAIQECAAESNIP